MIQLQASDTLGFHFERLQRESATGDVDEALTTNNICKNRFNKYVPFNRTRVRLEDSDGSDGYINASFIQSCRADIKFIATQSPLEDTVADFWLMVWQQKVHVIAALDHYDDSMEWRPYWPRSKTKSVYCPPIQVKLIRRLRAEFFISRDLELSDGESKRDVRQIQLTKWTDDSSFRPSDFVGFLHKVRQCLPEGPSNVIAHCR
ncbi:tyrosine-protein phosphatase non-receptor type 61F-like [Hyalella azteca]|uniref:Tyrosine-protein phosphatase non-receptor type 61F-like n=1 Tax=Hyalella azteca TaxID=294128 RepID=A0A979FU83_HYAAZ|nr:tyrosine-protein phosphatase non-receptor type 61F-like [Hyalella azteca]